MPSNSHFLVTQSQVAKACENLGVAYWRRTPKATADKAASNHGISAQKFQLIKVRLGRGDTSAGVVRRFAWQLIQPLCFIPAGVLDARVLGAPIGRELRVLDGKCD